MKKALIIVSCGLILALIIGASTQTKVEPADNNFNGWILDRKCTEDAGATSAKSPECALIDDHGDEQRAEIFLRDIKRRPRRAYA